MRPLEKWRMEAQEFNFAGARIAFWATRKPRDHKPWLLLIHGFPTSSWDWTRLWPDLKPHFNLIAADMLGFGLSDKPADIQYTISGQADLQEALLSDLGVGDAHILAHDYGDTVAQELLARSQEGLLSFSLKSICFLNGGLFPEAHHPLLAQRLCLTPLGPMVAALMRKQTLKRSFDHIFGPDTRASDAEINGHWALLNERHGRRILPRILQYIPERREKRARWVGAMEKSVTPMQHINGGADPISGAHLYRRFVELIPTADAVLLENIGHYPHTEAPGDVRKAFLAFQRAHGGLAN